jgi:hypothetical protein
MRRLSFTATFVAATLVTGVLAAVLPPAAPAALAPDDGPATPVHVQFRFAGMEPVPGWEAFDLDGIPFYLEPAVLLDETHFALASARRGRGEVWHVEVILTEEGTRLLGEITAENLERRLGMVVDGKLLSAPIIKAPITQGRALISGDIDEYEARRIAAGVMARHEVVTDEKQDTPVE